MSKIRRWFAVPLSNLSPAYDKYSGLYDKSRLPHNRFPHQAFTLDGNEIAIGLEKATDLCARLGREKDCPVVIETEVEAAELRTDHQSGIGAYVPGHSLRVVSLRYPQGDGHPETWPHWRLEDALAQSIIILAGAGGLKPWAELRPRTLSWLPVGQACQASCAFCFSKASVSDHYRGGLVRRGSLARLAEIAAAAQQAGAERAVITGGGEPTLLKDHLLCAGIEALARQLDRVVMITNGHLIARSAAPAEQARRWAEAGLTILSLSRHAAGPDRAARLMGLDVDTGRAIDAAHKAGLTARLIAVLQKGGVEDEVSLDSYLDQAVEWGVSSLTFKELYVSTALESDWSDRQANLYSAQNAIPLSLITNTAQSRGWTEIARLPWGSPVFQARHKGQALTIAAYTEPSVHWERSNGLVRSWNAMADGQVLASLEDSHSKVRV